MRYVGTARRYLSVHVPSSDDKDGHYTICCIFGQEEHP